MDSVDHSVLATALQWVENRDYPGPIWLATVIETFGSSPRPVGAMLALRRDGLLVGSVSGGCIEEDMADLAREGKLPLDRAKVLSYGVTREEAQRFGLPCGGVLRVLVEPVVASDWIRQILQLIDQHRLVTRRLDVESLQITVQDATTDSQHQFDGQYLVTVHGPRWRLLIIGAGQTSTYLAQIAQALDFEVIVCDPREEFRLVWDVPNTRLIHDMPDDAILTESVDSRTAVVALTHDPKLDDMALLEALKSPAFYVGALGSIKNNIKRRERLAMFDLSQEEIDRLHGPVGLNIGSRTPPEIAVAVLAHIISVKNQPTVDARLQAFQHERAR